MKRRNKIITIVTNVDGFEHTGAKTGLWLSELTKFWAVAEKAGYELDIASPSGGKIPLDPQGLIIAQIAGATGLRGDLTRRYEDRAFMDLLNDTIKVSEVDVQDYDAIYLVGGHGVMYDFTNHEPLLSLVAQFYEADKIVASVCHGAAGLVHVRSADGKYLIQGKRLTGFSWLEEKLAKRAKDVPYNLEAALQKRGGDYKKALIPFTSYVVVDGLLVTGQNPKSAKSVAKAVVHLLEEAKKE